MNTRPGDEECMRELARKRPGALQPLFTRYAPLVFHIASQSLDPATAEDIVQDVVLALWRKADTYNPKRGALRPWLLQIAHYRILNELRTRSRRPQLDPDVDADIVDELPDTTAEPVEAAWQTYRRKPFARRWTGCPPRSARR